MAGTKHGGGHHKTYRLPEDLPLTDREKEVLTWVANGLTYKEISRKLGISHQTVKNHCTTIRRKMKTKSIVAAALIAINDGLIEMEGYELTSRLRTRLIQQNLAIIDTSIDQVKHVVNECIDNIRQEVDRATKEFCSL